MLQEPLPLLSYSFIQQECIIGTVLVARDAAVTKTDTCFSAFLELALLQLTLQHPKSSHTPRPLQMLFPLPFFGDFSTWGGGHLLIVQGPLHAFPDTSPKMGWFPSHLGPLQVRSPSSPTSASPTRMKGLEGRACAFPHQDPRTQFRVPSP